MVIRDPGHKKHNKAEQDSNCNYRLSGIAQHTTDMMDTQEFLVFTGPLEWRMADSYWAARAPSALIYEIQDLLDDGNVMVHWEDLCLRAEELVQTSDELRNRRRIMRIIDGTKKLFVRMMRNESWDSCGEDYYLESDCDENGYDENCMKSYLWEWKRQ